MKSPRLALVSLALAAHAFAAPPSSPVSLRVNDVAAPVGTAADVAFGWLARDSDPDEIQSAYQLRVATSPAALASGRPDVWDSGRVASRLQNHVAYAGPALRADTRYHWQVRAWDRDGQPSPWSAPAAFDTGLLENSDWSGASWIRRDSKDADDYTRFRRRLDLPAGKPVVRAVAYVSAVHQYALHVNGAPAGKGQAYHHPQYQYYRAHDVTALLRAGAANQLGVFTHWFGGGQGRPASARGLLLKLVVHHADGSVTTLGTDAAWKQSRAEAWVTADLVHRNRGEGVGYVERIDAAKLDPEWTALAYDDSAWAPAAVVGPHPTAPWTGRLAPELTRVVERAIKPAAIADKGGGKYVIDLGRLWAGVPRVRFSGGRPGEIVSLRGADRLGPDGLIAKDAKSQSTLMEYRAILDGRDWTFEPVEYLGMRYLQIDNAPMPVTADNVAFVVRHSELDDAASDFDSPDPVLNAVWALMKHSLFTCAQEEFVDTPTREKGGFLGDSVIQSMAAMPALRERALTRRALGEFIQSMEQHWSKPADRGRMNAVYPNNDGGRDIPDFTQAYPLWAWAYYMETGDRAFLEKAYPYLNDIGGYVARHISPDTGLVERLTGGKGPYEFGIIDWPATMRYGHDMSAVARTVINGWAVADFQTLARIADALGRTDDAAAHRARAARLAEAINARLRTASGLYHDGLRADGSPSPGTSQHANMFPLALGLVPEADRAAVIDHVVKKRMSVGMVTVSWLVRALGEAGRGEALLDLLTNKNQPGWARTLARGGTATWESWDADETGQSLSHAWGAAGMEAHLRHVLGVRPLAPQYEETLVAPLDFGDRLAWAKGRLATDRGEIAVEWRRVSAADYTLRLELPVNVTARVSLPRGGAVSPVVLLDGRPASFVTEGDRLVVHGVGSGARVIERREAAR